MKLGRRLRYLLSLPPDEAARRIGRRLLRLARLRVLRLRDALRPSAAARCPNGPLRRLLSETPPLPDPSFHGLVADLCARHLDHRFDLLGSGFVQVAHGLDCAGVEGVRYAPAAMRPYAVNPANRKASRRLRSLIDDPGYAPIDWHVDFKSGFRFSPTAWHTAIPVGRHPGADVKVPWELARMYHLPRLALAYGLARAHPDDGRFAPAERYRREFRNQVLDFLAANPPRFGVNWVCPMEVAIRAANMLLAHDLFLAWGAAFDPPFTEALAQAAWDHGRHVAANLEWDPEARGNHYFGDVAGLLFVAAALPASPETDAWLAFAAGAVATETAFQFHPDGGNFEASTSYHRLSTEMALHATALVLGLSRDGTVGGPGLDRRCWNREPPLPPTPLPAHPLPGAPDRTSPLPEGHFRRLRQAVAFAAAIALPNGLTPQIGDNDSGRFCNLLPACALTGNEPLREIVTDHRHLAAAAAGLFDDPAFADAARSRPFDAALVQALAGLGSRRLGLAPAADPTPAPCGQAALGRWREGDGQAVQSVTLDIPLPVSDLDPTALSPRLFPDFGLAMVTGPDFHLAVRCPEPGPRRHWGHGHCDLLAVELFCAGRHLVADPGSYLYTPFPALRNAYRGPQAHFVPWLEGVVPADLDADLFALRHHFTCRRLAFGPHGFAGELRAPGLWVRRIVEILPDRVRVTDVAPAAGPKLLGPNRPSVAVTQGYGTKTTRPVCAF